MKKSLLALGISVCLSGILLAVPMETAAADATYTFGIQDDSSVEATLNPPPLFNKQGLNNFYAYYSLDNNVGGKVKAASLKECEFSVNKNSYAMKTMVPGMDDVNNYLNTVWPQLYPGQNPQFWWKINNLGIVAPAGNMVAVVGFKAPVDGSYVIKAECYGGAKDDQGYVADKADGVSFAVMNKDVCLWSQPTGKTFKGADNSYKVPEKTLQMSKDEAVYFTVDPNKTFENDMGHWYIVVTQKPATEATSSKETSNSASSGGGQPEKNDNGSTTAASQIADDTQPSESDEQVVTSFLTSDTTNPPEEIHGSETIAKVGENDSAKNSGTWIIWLIIALVLAVGGGFTAFYFVRKKQGIDLFKKK